MVSLLDGLQYDILSSSLFTTNFYINLVLASCYASSKQFPYVSKADISFQHRAAKTIEIITKINPDIIALQVGCYLYLTFYTMDFFLIALLYLFLSTFRKLIVSIPFGVANSAN